MTALNNLKYSVGIDLGTTYSCIACYRNNQAEVIPNLQGNRTTPSYVAFTPTTRLVGEAAKHQEAGNVKNTIFDSKRFIGLKFDDPQVQEDLKYFPFEIIDYQSSNSPAFSVTFQGKPRIYTPEEIGSMILGNLKKSAEVFLGCTEANPIEEAVIAVPANFNDSQRQATKDAAKIAGFKSVRVTNEPTAAAIAYGLDKVLEHKKSDQDSSKGKTVLVYDLGGGTFDVTVLRIDHSKLEFKVLATAGDSHLGGSDFDVALTNYLLGKFQEQIGIHDIAKTQPKVVKRLRYESELVKRILSASMGSSVDIDCLYKDHDFNMDISRAEFEEICQPLFTKTLDTVKLVLKDAGLQPSDIDDVALVGGSTRIPKIKSMIEEMFSSSHISREINPDEAVARGASMLADSEFNKKIQSESGNENAAKELISLIDVTPLSLGIELAGRKMEVMIPRNTTLPAKFTKCFTTFKDNDTSVSINVYEGERKLVTENNLLGIFKLQDIPPLPRGVPIIEATFAIDVNGILSVDAIEHNSNKSIKYSILNQKGRLSQNRIESMIREAEMLKQEDELNVQRVDARIQIETRALALKSILESEEHKTRLAPEVYEKIENEIQKTLDWVKDVAKKMNSRNFVATVNDTDSDGETFPYSLKYYHQKRDNLEAVCLPILADYDNEPPPEYSSGNEDYDEEVPEYY